MKKYKEVLIAVNLIVVLIFFNYSVYEKEQILSQGRLVLLKLAPVDPRSLMQGDYMQLRYEIAQNVDIQKLSKSGYLIIKNDEVAIANKVRFQKDPSPLHKDEVLIKYRLTEYDLNIGAESFFFEEGQAEKFESAEYGGLRVDENGNSVLTGLYDKNKKLIE